MIRRDKVMGSFRLRKLRARITRKKSHCCRCSWWPLVCFTILGMICIWYIHKGYQSHFNGNCSAEEEDMELEFLEYGIQKHSPVLVHVVQVIRPATWCDLKQTFNVCLATQTSVDRLFHIGHAAENWQGPLSLAIYVTKVNELALVRNFINFMRICHYQFKTTVSVTIAVPYELRRELHGVWNPKRPLIKLDEEGARQGANRLRCEEDQSLAQLLEYGKNLSKTKDYRKYPQNHLRNIARSHCETDWVLTTDVDLIPKNNSASDLQAFYESEEAQSCHKCAFVIPTFGVVENCTRLPVTKMELLQMVNASLAEPFHVKSWEPAQKQTNYQKWATTYLEEGPVHISHKVIHNFTAHLVFHNKLNFYEPFYIAPNSIPYYDTRFVGYGFTRSSQTFESIVAGWRFYVLTPVFNMHYGIAKKQDWDTYRRSPRALQTRRNKPIYHIFSKTIWTKYHHVVRQLPPPSAL